MIPDGEIITVGAKTLPLRGNIVVAEDSELPDGNNFNVGAKRFRCAEVSSPSRMWRLRPLAWRVSTSARMMSTSLRAAQDIMLGREGEETATRLRKNLTDLRKNGDQTVRRRDMGTVLLASSMNFEQCSWIQVRPLDTEHRLLLSLLEKR